MNDTYINETYRLRRLNDINEKNKILIVKKIRRVSSNDSSKEYEIEEYLTPCDSEPFSLELREKMNCSNCSE